MLISLNEVKKYVKIPEGMTTKELLELIGSRLVEIEEAIDLAPKYKGVYVVKVQKCEPIEGTHLSLCQIDAGDKTVDFANGSDTVQVVCGAPNAHVGMLAVWITPGAIVPQTYGNENFRLSVRKLQGYESYGMLAGADELDLDTEHRAIAEIDPKMAKPGDSFAEVFELDDTIIDVENKSLTHRPDCFGLIGFAREVAGILGEEFKEPEWIGNEETTGRAEVEIELDSDLCPRYSCAVFELPENQPSKYLTREAVFLAKAGMRAIDPLVDLTNIVMLRTGQPLHAFDYDKFVALGGAKKPKIVVRAAKDGEELQLLDGKTIACIPEDILITSNDVPVALAGAMGGKNTEIDVSTKRVILESATFSLYHLRKTQMAHGIFSEAITRFTKGQPAAMTLPVLNEAVAELKVEKVAQVADKYPELDKLGKNVVRTGRDIDFNLNSVITISTDEVNKLLGTRYETETIERTLENVGFDIKIKGERLDVKAPAWRTDIHIAEDVIEEVGRLLGFDNIELALPRKPFSGTEIAPMWKLKKQLRQILSDRLGMHELLTYSFVSKDLLTKVGQNVDDSYEIVNSISPELQCFRQQIVPSLIDKVRENVKAGHKDFTIYEMNQITKHSMGLSTEKTPVLGTDLGIVKIGDFYALKAEILMMAKRGLRVTLEYAAMTPNSAAAAEYPYLEPLRSAAIILNGETIGAFGELKAAVMRRFKLEGVISVAELKLEPLLELKPELMNQTEISRFPFVERDLTLKVAADAAFGRFHNAIDMVLADEGLISESMPLSIYQATPETKNISFHLKFSSPEKTLDQAEISAIMNKMSAKLVELGAEVI